MNINTVVNIGNKIQEQTNCRCFLCGKELLYGEISSETYSTWCTCGLTITFTQNKNNENMKNI